jgi:hypothetical protein
MNREEYYKRIERINDKFRTDRVSADEEYQLVCQKNYLSTKYIEHLEQQCKKQKEIIDKIKKEVNEQHTIMGCEVVENWLLLQILEDKEMLE